MQGVDRGRCGDESGFCVQILAKEEAVVEESGRKPGIP
jgi:hypothetical protein